MSYPGAKGQAGVFQRIIGQMPPHHTYIEAFFGSGKIFHTKRRATINCMLDLNAKHLPKADFGMPFIQPINACAIDFLGRILKGGPDDKKDTLVYCDPPYILSTRKNRRYYEHEMTLQEHERLVKILIALDCMVMISGYPHPLYDEAFYAHGWRCISYRTRTRGRTLTECLWCNFPEPTVLHDWRFAGQSHRQRVSFKRVAARWLARLAKMHPRKRGYLLNELGTSFPALGSNQPEATPE